MDCERSITFLIPGTAGVPSVEVKAVEDNGSLDFTVKVLTAGGFTADLRGLFFNVTHASKLAGLTVTEDGGKVTEYRTGNVIDLGNGANMQGKASPFDVGLEFGTQGIGKDDIQLASFTLSNTNHDLTLDDIANTLFGARLTSVGHIGGPRNDSAKLTAVAPAAPDAHDDAYNIFEDGQSGLNDPSTVPEGVKFEVLANDTDADGNKLSVTHVEGALHGTVSIVDGADSDSLPGDAVLYTPFEDYAGSDSFTYCIADDHGGTDFAQVAVTIAAVADVPDLDVQVLPGSVVNEIVFHVTATQTDADSSEYIDRILTSSLPAGVTLTPVTVDPGAELDQVYQEYVLTLPLDADANFGLTFTAYSKETPNGDEESASKTVNVVYEFNSTTTNVQFTAENQSIWDTGPQFTFVDDRFVGVNTGNFDKDVGGALYAGVSGHIKLGFQSTLTFEGGEIDATSNYDVTVDTNYNKTTDVLQIDTGALLTGASFSTEGPEGSYTLNFIYDVLLDAFAGVNIDFGSIDFDPLGVIPGDQTLDLGGIHRQVDIPTIDVPGSASPGSFNVLDLDSNSLSGTIDFPAPLDAFSVNYAWPNITTNETYPPNPVEASGSSNNFLELDLDVDTLVTELLGIPNVFDPPRETAGPFFANLDILDVDVTGGLNFLQDFKLGLGNLTGLLQFEDGSNQAFNIGDSLVVSNASLKDSDDDGLVEFAFKVVPTATLANETKLGFNIGGEIKLLSVELGYDITIPNPFGDDVHESDSISLGPLADFGETAPVGDIPVYNNTFALNFGQEEVGVFA